MLQTVDGKTMRSVPHGDDFNALVGRLGDKTTNAVRDFLDKVIDELSCNQQSGLRSFSSSELGSRLSPWEEPLAQLYCHAEQFLGGNAPEQDVQDRAALWFGLFVWERIMDREELWTFWDANLDSHDPNREPMGKVYFENA